MNLYSNAVKIRHCLSQRTNNVNKLILFSYRKILFYFNVSYSILSQVFCNDIMFLFPHHQLCVKQDLQFAGSSSDYLLPSLLGSFIWSKSSLLSLLCLTFRLSMYNKTTVPATYPSNTASFSFDNYS